MSDFSKEIQQIVDESLSDDMIKDIVRENIRSAVEKSIKASFDYGKLGRALSDKIEETLVPYIDSYDMSAYVTKLDTILTDVINNTDVTETQSLLKKFNTIMTPVKAQKISLHDIFIEYCKYASKNCDTDGRDVVYDSGPKYEDFECCLELKDISSEYSLFERYSVDLTADIKPYGSEELNLNFTLQRWRNEDSFTITNNDFVCLNSLRYLSDFEVYLLSLARANVKIDAASVISYEEYITPEKEPEPTFE